MAAAYQVNGTATITWDSSGLGICSADGVSIKINQHRNEIYSDERGPNIPSEIVGLGVDATITFQLWKYDAAVLNAAIAKRSGGTLGAMGTVGDLMFTNTRTSTLSVASPIDNHVWTFNRVFIADDCDFTNLSTGDINKVDVVVRAVPDVSGIVGTRT